MKKEMICIVCPRGCTLTIDTETMAVSGNSCPKGEEYAINETTRPVRTVTSSVRVTNRENVMVSVKTAAPVPKSEMFEVMKRVHAAKAEAPVKIGDVIIKDLYGTDLIATKTIE